MISKSKNHNPNYLAKIVYLKEFKEHPNANKLKIATVDYMDVITGIDNPEGIYVYFPVDSRINSKVLHELSLYNKEELNKENKKGFFSKNRKVTAVKLRGTKSFGFILPAEELAEIFDVIPRWAEFELDTANGVYFDTINGQLLVDKYEAPGRQEGSTKSFKKTDKIKKILIDKQFKFHFETEHLNKNLGVLKINVPIYITRKRHGSSLILANVKVNKKLKWYEKGLIKLGINIEKEEYGYIWSSGKPKSRLPKGICSSTQKWNNSKSGNIWSRAYTELNGKLEKGITLYGEITGIGIQGDAYTYNSDYAIHIYRITSTNVDGITREFSWDEVKEYCTKYSIEHSEEYETVVLDNVEGFMEKISTTYLDKSYPDCKVDEGVCVRQDKKIFKLKSPNFILKESGKKEKPEPATLGFVEAYHPNVEKK